MKNWYVRFGGIFMPFEKAFEQSVLLGIVILMAAPVVLAIWIPIMAIAKATTPSGGKARDIAPVLLVPLMCLLFYAMCGIAAMLDPVLRSAGLLR